MKRKHVLSCAVILSAFLLLSSCKKDLYVGGDKATPEKVGELTIASAQSYFGQTTANSRYNKQKTSRNAVFHQMVAGRKVLWDKASLTRTSKGLTVKAPIDLGGAKIRFTDGGVLPYSALNYLMMYKDSTHQMHVEWVILNPDLKWLNGDRKVYKGKIEIANWEGSLLKKFNLSANAASNATTDTSMLNDKSLNRDMLAAASGTKIVSVCFWSEIPGLAFDPCIWKADYNGVCDQCKLCYEWHCFNTTDMTPIDVDDPPVDPGSGGGGTSPGGVAPVYIMGPDDSGDYTPSNCNPDPNYQVPNTPPPAGMEWVLPCGNGPTEVPLPIPADPVTTLSVLTSHLEITDAAQITFLMDHGDIQEGLLSILKKNPSDEATDFAKGLLAYFYTNQTVTWSQFVSDNTLDLSSYGGPKICLKSLVFSPQSPGSDVNNSKVWGIPAIYTTPNNELFSLVFGVDNYAPTDIQNWSFLDKIPSHMNYQYLWDNEDIRKLPNGHYQFSKYAQQVIFADAINYGSYWASELAKSGATAATYKSKFVAKMTEWLNHYYPGATMLMLNSNPGGAQPCVLTDGNPENCN